MIDFSSLDLFFFDTEPETRPGEMAVLRYRLTMSSAMDMRFTIDSPLHCVHVPMTSGGTVLAKVGTEGVSTVSVYGSGDGETLDCVVEPRTLIDKVLVSWKSAPHLRSHLLERGGSEISEFTTHGT